MLNRSGFIFWLAAISLCVIGSANAELYKWKGEDGRIFYSDKPPPGEKLETAKYSSPEITDGFKKTSVEKNINKNRANNKTVVLYSATWCGVCKKAKAYFEAEGIPYKEFDIENTRKGRVDYAKLKGTGVPIIMIGDERLNGFSQGRFEKMYDS